jgi:acyl-CoA thioester hydrolase
MASGHHTQGDNAVMSDVRLSTTPLVATTPRPHPHRSRLDLYPIVDTNQARYADMDVNGHLNNLSLEALHENARAVLNLRVMPDAYETKRRSLRIVSSQNVVHFLAEAHWPAHIHVGVGVGRVGNTSFVGSSALFVEDQCISTCDTVLVLVGDHGPVPIPDETREALASLLLPQLA